MRTLTICSIAAGILVSASALAEPIIGITGSTAGTNVVRFDSNSPGTVTTVGPLTGIVAGHSVRALDRRPANNTIYVLSTNTTTGFQLYTLNESTGALTPVGSGGTVSFTWPARVSMDFNPAADRIRVVGGGAQNLRLNPDTGALVQEDTALAYVAGDPNAAGNPPFPVGVAYDFNDTDPNTATTMYVYDFDNDALGRVGSVGGSPVSPNTGQITTIFTPPSFVTGDGGVGFDISSGGAAYLSYADITGGVVARKVDGETEGVAPELFSRINLTTGAITVIGTLPVDLLDFTVGTEVLPPANVPTANRFGLALLGLLIGVGGLIAVRRFS